MYIKIHRNKNKNIVYRFWGFNLFKKHYRFLFSCLSLVLEPIDEPKKKFITCWRSCKSAVVKPPIAEDIIAIKVLSCI